MNKYKIIYADPPQSCECYDAGFEAGKNNMEPEKIVLDANDFSKTGELVVTHINGVPIEYTEPEKKDVWEDKIRNNAPETGIYHVDGAEYNVDEDTLIDFIKTHFISRAEVVERVEKAKIFWTVDGEMVKKDDLSDLLTQEK